MKRNYNKHHGKIKIRQKCHVCQMMFKSEEKLNFHLKSKHSTNSEWKIRKSALNRTAMIFTRTLHMFIGFEIFLTSDWMQQFVNFIEIRLLEAAVFKMAFIVFCLFSISQVPDESGAIKEVMLTLRLVFHLFWVLCCIFVE